MVSYSDAEYLMSLKQGETPKAGTQMMRMTCELLIHYKMYKSLVPRVGLDHYHIKLSGDHPTGLCIVDDSTTSTGNSYHI